MVGTSTASAPRLQGLGTGRVTHPVSALSPGYGWAYSIISGITWLIPKAGRTT